MHPNLPGLVRIPVFAALLVFSLIVLGINAHLIAKLHFNFDEFGIHYSISAPGWTKLGLATAVLTLVSLLPMLVIDFIRKGAPTSLVVVELGWLGFLWIMWLATAADTANNVNCGGVTDNGICSEAQASEAFAFLAWLLLMAYWVLLLVYAIMAHTKGNNNVWMGSTTDQDFSAGGSHSGAGIAPPHPGLAQQQMTTGGTGATYPPHNV